MRLWSRPYGRREGDISVALVDQKLDLHVEQCQTDKAETHRKLDEHDKRQNQMHTENQQRLSRLERVVYIAAGAGVAISVIANHPAVVAKVLQ